MVFSKVEIDFAGAGITGSGGQDDFFTMNPHLLNGIDVSQVQDIGKLYDASFLKPNFFCRCQNAHKIELFMRHPTKM